ncbi:glycosyltransferase [Geodermatophilus sp. SYSU D00684]
MPVRPARPHCPRRPPWHRRRDSSGRPAARPGLPPESAAGERVQGPGPTLRVMPRVLLAFEPPDGGVAEHVSQLAVQLAPHGWDVEVAGPQESSVHARLEAAGVTVHRLPLTRGYGDPRVDAAALRALSALLGKGRYDLVHCHSAKVGVLGRLAARRARVPAVYTPHALPFVGPFSTRRRVASRLVERVLAPLAERIICVSEHERNEAVAAGLGGEDRLRVVPNGCPPCTEGPDGAADLRSMPGSGPLLGAVAVMRRQKRLDLLLDAAPEILRRVPDSRVVLVGNGPLAADLHRRAEALGLAEHPRFRILPFAPPASRYLRCLDVFVLPSDWESLPIALLEALACGVPQIATDVGGTSEVVDRETGVLVPPGDVHALTDAACDLLTDGPRRRRMAEASTVRYREAFTVERMVERTVAVYAEAVESRSSVAESRRPDAS